MMDRERGCRQDNVVDTLVRASPRSPAYAAYLIGAVRVGGLGPGGRDHPKKYGPSYRQPIIALLLAAIATGLRFVLGPVVILSGTYGAL